MKPPARIEQWMTVEKMFRWLQEAPDQSAHKRRMAIWLTHTGKLHARKVAEILDVSTQAVWLWISQYNDHGPKGLERKGRGGRRWSYLTVKQESKILKPFMQKVRAGKNPSPASLKTVIEKELGRSVSMPYVYRLLARHNWAQEIAQSHATETQSTPADDFTRYAHPWLISE